MLRGPLRYTLITFTNEEQRTKEIKLLMSSHPSVELKEIPCFQLSPDTDSYAHLVTIYQVVISIER